jgi:hypothetical protein
VISLAAELHRIDTKVARHHVEQPFAKEVRLEPPGRPHGADRRLAGHQRLDRDGDVANAVRAGQELRRLRRHHPAVGADIGAHVAVDVAAQAEDDPVARAGDLDVAVDLARVVGRHQVLAAILDPFHRPADVAGRERNQEILGIELAAHPEAAADVGLDHVDRALRQPEHGRQHLAVEEQNLGGAENREPAVGCIPFGDQAAGLQRQPGKAVTTEALAAAVVRLGEGRIGVAERHAIAHRAVAAALLEQQRPVARRRVPVRHRRQRLDVHANRFERVFGQSLGLGHHYRQRLTDIAHFFVGDHRLKIGLELRQVRKPQRDHRDGLADLGGSDHRVHAFDRARGGRIEVADAAMRHAAAQDHRVQHALALEIIDEFARTGEKAQVFRSIDRLTDQRGGGHVHG